MPRAVYKKFYDHDDRASGSANIRKVSFMNGVGGRIKKNRSPQFVKQNVFDDDIEMGSSDRKLRKGRKRNKNFKHRSGSPTLRHQKPGPRQPPLTLSDWYQVKILYGAKYDKFELHRLMLKHTAPKMFLLNICFVSGPDLVFYTDDFDTALLLRNANRKILLEDGHLMQIRVREGTPPILPMDKFMKNSIESAMAKRYNGATKALDLTDFNNDSELQGTYYCPLSRPPFMKNIWQIISENMPDLVAINLSRNKISVFDDSHSLEIKKLKNLKIVYLGENNIKSVHVLNCFKDSEITELELRKNPLVNFFKDNAHYVSELRKKFPKLTKLDGIDLPPVITFDVTNETKLPAPQAAFMCNPDGRGIVKEFLSQYFALYDSDNRLDLAQAYHDTSSFSLNAYYPPKQKSNTSNNQRLDNYMPKSRNLFRLNDYPRRKNRLHLGKQNIVQCLSQLPKTQHDLSSFMVDLTLFTPVLINLLVTGVFREPTPLSSAKSWPKRHFSRIFLIVPVGQGFCIINDMLSITNATDDEVQCSFADEAPSTSSLNCTLNTQNDANVLKLAAAVGSVELDDSVRLQMVQTLATRTGMNLAWSKKCLDETQWNFDRAVWTFTELQSKNSIPPEAFVK